jgi:nucleotide-binding universal stress UspA family protein
MSGSDQFASAKESLEALAREEFPERGPGIVTVRQGRAFDQISSFAREIGADLIVVTTHGYTGLKHVLLGSTAELVVRHAPCPVLILRQQPPKATRASKPEPTHAQSI